MSQETKQSLNAGQQAAADGFFSFLFSEDKELIISGAGGVGKTFLMGYLIDVVLPQYFNSCELMGIKPIYDNVEMTATTNKAAEVLSIATNRPCSTIHSFMNLRVKENYKTGKTELLRSPGWVVHTNKILFIDEGSMIDSDLRAKILEGTHECKIVYVGDHSQLPPVFEDLSPIYKDDLPFFELTEPMRNSSQPALMAVCQQIRETVKTGVFQPIKAVPGVIDWLDQDDVLDAVREHFIDNNFDSRILAYSNPQVNNLNSYIRSAKGLPIEYTVGEELISNSAVQLNAKETLSIEEPVKILRVDSETRMINLGKDVELEVRLMDIEANFGSKFYDVPVPVDKAYFEQLVKYYANKKDWSMYFALKQKYPDLRPRSACTVHKSQGSSYDTVFIDLDNLSTCHQPKLAARLLYVAFTRARNRIILYGNLASKYGGIVE